jgi:hypothetical protein
MRARDILAAIEASKSTAKRPGKTPVKPEDVKLDDFKLK